MISRRNARKAIAVALATSALMMTHISASAATHYEYYDLVAAGAGGGWEYPPVPADECDFAPLPIPDGLPAVTLTHDSFELAHYGTWNVFEPGPEMLRDKFPVASFLGQTTTKIMVESHMISPLGTHQDLGTEDCPWVTSNGVPSFVDITSITIEGEAEFTRIPPFPLGNATRGFVSCVGTSGLPAGDKGDYMRMAEAVVFTAVVECTIKGNVVEVRPDLVVLETPTVGVLDNVTVLIEGEMTPCSPPFRLVSNPECAEAPPPDGASARLHTAMEAVALN